MEDLFLNIHFLEDLFLNRHLFEDSFKQELIISEDKIFDFEEKAQGGGSEVKVISIETREGVQLRDLGGIAAILRFEI